MALDSVDITLWLAGAGMNAALLALLTWRRIFRAMPAFYCYTVWSLVNNAPAMYAVHLSAEGYIQFWLIEMTLEMLFQFVVLAELTRSVLRCNRASPPRLTIVVLLLALAILPLWSVVHWTPPAHAAMLALVYMRFRQAFSILMVTVFLTLAILSRLQGLRWPDRELRIASGLGFMAVVTLAVFMFRTHPMPAPAFHRLDQALVASCLGAYAYWVLSFATKDAGRQRFSPQT